MSVRGFGLLLLIALASVPAYAAQEAGDNVLDKLDVAAWLYEGEFKMDLTARHGNIETPMDADIAGLIICADIDTEDEAFFDLATITLGAGGFAEDYPTDTGGWTMLPYSQSKGEHFFWDASFYTRLIGSEAPGKRAFYVGAGYFGWTSWTSFHRPISMLGYNSYRYEDAILLQAVKLAARGNCELADGFSLSCSAGWLPYAYMKYFSEETLNGVPASVWADCVRSYGQGWMGEAAFTYRPTQDLSIFAGYRFHRFDTEGYHIKFTLRQEGPFLGISWWF